MNREKASRTFQIGGRQATYVLIICSLLYMVNYMDRQVMAVVLEPMRQDLGLTDAEAGWLNTIFFVSVGLFCIPIAYFIDRWSRRKMIGLMAIFWSAFTLLTGFGVNFLSVFMARIGVGIGEAGYSAGGTALITASYPEGERSKKLGIFNMFITIGIVLVGTLSDIFGGGREGILYALYISSCAGFLASLLWWMSSRYYPADIKRARDVKLSSAQ
jgi:MFS family permease